MAVSVDGGQRVGTAAYVAPSTVAAPPAVQARRSATRFWRSPLAMLARRSRVALLFGFVVVAIVAARRTAFARRMAEFVSRLPSRQARRRHGAVTDRALVDRGQLARARRAGGTRFKEELEIARDPLPAIQIVPCSRPRARFWSLLLCVLRRSTGRPLLAARASRSASPRSSSARLQQRQRELRRAAPGQPAGARVGAARRAQPRRRARGRRRRRRRAVADASSGACIADEQLGRAARGRARRRRASAWTTATSSRSSLVAALQRETGGNTAEVLDRVAETIRERFELRRLVKTLTAQGRMSRWVVSLLPVVLLLRHHAASTRTT